VPSPIAWRLHSPPQGLGYACCWPLTQPTTPHPPLGHCAMGSSMNSSSRLSHLQPSLLQMSLICICIAVLLRPCSQMRMLSKTLIVGFPILPVGSNAGKSSRNGCGNLRLEFGQQAFPTAMRLTELPYSQLIEPAQAVEAVIYGPPQWAGKSYTKGFSGSDFVLQPDGTLRCPADHPLYPQERRPERTSPVCHSIWL
jgi:hypothetical protein